MRADVKEKWIEALRSGLYHQAVGALKQDDGLCCLGVLCEVVGLPTRRGFREELFEFLFPADDGGEALAAYDLPPGGFQGLSYNQMSELSELNDTGESFGTIAKFIERNIPAEEV